MKGGMGEVKLEEEKFRYHFLFPDTNSFNKYSNININKQTNFEYDFWAKVKALMCMHIVKEGFL